MIQLFDWVIIYITYFFDILNIIGQCDKCGSKLYKDGDFLETVDMRDKVVGLQYCNYDCLNKHKNNYPFIDNIMFQKHDINEVIYKKTSFLSTITFIFKYKHMVANKNAPEMIEFIHMLKECKNLSDEEIKFLDDVKSYGIC